MTFIQYLTLSLFIVVSMFVTWQNIRAMIKLRKHRDECLAALSKLLVSSNALVSHGDCPNEFVAARRLAYAVLTSRGNLKKSHDPATMT